MKQICSDCAGMGRFDDFMCETCKGTGFVPQYASDKPDTFDLVGGDKLSVPSLYRLRPFTFATLQARVFGNRSGNQGEGAK